jgi:hypothetical protein
MAKMRMYAALLGCLALAVIAPAAADSPPKFLPGDPIWVDPDRMSIPEPREIELSKTYDLLENTYMRPGGSPGAARNVNTLGEVPDSSWFENRMTVRAMSLEDLARGPNRGTGPELSKGLMITALKTQGITPGFTVKDGTGATYLVKVDPLHYPQMTTSAEVVGTKFFHAFGYHVPENYIAFVKRADLKVGPGAKVTGSDGRKRRLRESDIDVILKRVPVRSDGTIQIMASLYLPGKPVGRFKYYGTRSDDPNDVIPHEDRRELRALRVFDSWLNHNDSDAVNSLDMYVTERDRKYVKHHLIDFGTVLGSGAFEPKALRAGNEYYIEMGPTIRSALTLGLWDRPWRTIDYPDFPAVARFESEYFQPESWKPDYPNPAHDRMTPVDAFWAARTVARFSDDAVRAIVRTGRYSDPAAEEFLVRALIQRRDKILRYYLGLLNPLDDFRVSGNDLVFRNLGADAGLGSPSEYRFQWFRFDNSQGQLASLGGPRSARETKIEGPADSAPFLMVRIETVAPGQPAWAKKVDVYIRNGPSKAVVGVQRES